MDVIIDEVFTKSVLTKSNLPIGDYSVNPYVGCTHSCKYCYANFMKRFTNHPEPWGDFLDIKYWPDIKNPEKYRGKALFFGSVTDPYLPEEETFRRTRSLLEQLHGSGIKLSIQTKSDMVLRDLDIIKTFQDARVGFSINTLDEDFKNDMDKAVSIERRLSAMKILHDSGIRTTCFISPIFPGITDVISIIERVKNQCNLVWLENLNLRGSYKPVIMNYIREKHPDLLSLYDEIYQQCMRWYWEDMDNKVREYTKANGLEYVRNDDSMKKPFEAPPVVVNFFYHEEIKKSSTKGRK
ncbi:MAG: radical SAM mobile pair protein B [Sphaerochaeta sp.]